MQHTDRFWQWRGADLLLHCHVQPGSSRERIVGEHGGRLRVRVSAPPVDGEANRRLCMLLAREFGVRDAAVELESGHGSRLKSALVRAPARLPLALGIEPTARSPHERLEPGTGRKR